MKKVYLCAALIAMAMTGQAQTEVTTYTPGNTAEGVAYFLPKTLINVAITVEKEVYTPGELCQYADRFLRISDISDKEQMQYNIKHIALSTTGVADADHIYHIRFNDRSVAPLVNLTEEGILLSINTPNVADEKTSPRKPVKVICPANPRSFMTEEMLMATSKVKMAELVAKEIYAIRESKNMILRGQNESIPKDGEGLQIILNELDAQERALTSLFTGTRTKTDHTETYQVTPAGDVNRAILGRFSRKLGLLHKDDLAGAPIYIDIKDLKTVPNQLTEEAAKKRAKRKQEGVVYNLPGKAEVKVYTNTKTYAEEALQLTQLGTTEVLTSSYFSKKKDIRVTLNPVNGAIVSVEE